MSHLDPIYAVWGHNAEAMAADIGQPGVKVRQWRNRGNIPSDYWQKIVDAAAAKNSRLELSQFIRPAADRSHGSAASDRRIVLCALCERRVDRGVIECTAIDCPHSEKAAA